MNEEMRFCQSCGMPMQAAGDFGTEADGGASADYCVYCYKNGAFTEACTMEEMIRHCAGFHEEFRDENGKSYTREEAVRLMREYFRRSSAGANNGTGRKFRSVFVSAAELRYICPGKNHKR